MKFSLVILSVLALSTSAFAKTYQCDVLRDADHHAIMGGPSYGVAIDTAEDSVILQVTTGADEGHALQTASYPMEKVSQEADGATYEAYGVTATIITTLIQGRPRTDVTINRSVGPTLATAACEYGRM